MMDDDEDDGRTDDPFRERKEPQSKQRHHEDQMALAAKCQCRWWVPCIFFCDPSTSSPSSGATTHGTFRKKKKKRNRERGAVRRQEVSLSALQTHVPKTHTSSLSRAGGKLMSYSSL